MANLDEDAKRALREQLELVDDDLRTAGGGIDAGTQNDKYLRGGLLRLHEAVPVWRASLAGSWTGTVR